ncbi:hypothetical protein SEA_NERGAL_63 [Mycobacterium Phage Nergal]|nr:hypothetical protein SEA_NERGAL_63 [Mycobacterium Phage Nergal]
MSVDPIELSAAERRAAVKVVEFDEHPEAADLVEAIVEAINDVRLGDPVGTLRRSGAGLVAERRQGEGVSRYWHLLVHNGDQMKANSAELVADADTWEVVYQPGVLRIPLRPLRLPVGEYTVSLYPPQDDPTVEPWVIKPEGRPAMVVYPQRPPLSPEACPQPDVCRLLSCAELCRLPRVVAERGLSDAETGCAWLDKDGTRWRFSAATFEWQAMYEPTGEWYVAIPSQAYAPYREVIE